MHNEQKIDHEMNSMDRAEANAQGGERFDGVGRDSASESSATSITSVDDAAANIIHLHHETTELLKCFRRPSLFNARLRKANAETIVRLELHDASRTALIEPMISIFDSIQPRNRDARIKRLVKRVMLPGVAVSTLIAASLALDEGLRFTHWATMILVIFAVNSVFIAVAASPLTVTIGIVLDQVRRRRLRPLISAMGELSWPEFGPTLANAATHRAFEPVATVALKQTLKASGANTPDLTEAEAVRSLCSIVERGKAEEELTLLIVRALSHSVSTRALQAMERLERLDRRPAVREAARESQSAILSAIKEAQNPRTLLRASGHISDASIDHLRPVLSSGDPQSDELLMPFEEANQDG